MRPFPSGSLSLFFGRNGISEIDCQLAQLHRINDFDIVETFENEISSKGLKDNNRESVNSVNIFVAIPFLGYVLGSVLNTDCPYFGGDLT